MVASQLVSFSIGSALGVRYDLIWAFIALRSWNICEERFTDMRWSTWNRLVQNKKVTHTRYGFLLRKHSTVIESRYYNLLARIFRVGFVLVIAQVWSAPRNCGPGSELSAKFLVRYESSAAA